MKKAAVLIALLFGLVVAGVAFANNGEATYVLEAGKKGAVHFDHAKHQAMDGMTCGECHHDKDHKAVNDAAHIAGKCDKCHEGKKTKKVFHKNCKGCHKAKGAGPTKCSACHKK